jgi:hypothetical protein
MIAQGPLRQILRVRSISLVSSKRAAGLLVVTLLTGCQPQPSTAPSVPGATGASAEPSTASATPAASLDRVAGWQGDLALIVPALERIHPDAFHSTSKDAMEAAVTDLASRAATLTDDQLMVGVSRIAALVSAGGCDAHTGMYPWGSGTYPVDSLPLRLWLFGDELVVVDALPPYHELIGAAIEAIDGEPIDTLLATLDPLIPRDNEETVRLLDPRFILTVQVLRGVNVAGDGAVRLQFAEPDAGFEVDVDPIPMSEYNAWAGAYGLHLPSDPDVLYLSRIDDALWWEMLPDDETLFVQYNRVDRLPSDVTAGLEATMADPAVARIVLDLRHNFGGELAALNDMSPRLVKAAATHAGGMLVVTGRNTFSAGSLLVARLKAQTNATVVGEPMGGCPTIYSDPETLDLPWSGLSINIASDTAVGVDPDDQRRTIEPDIAAELSREEWADGDDPALALVLPVAP